MKNFKNLGAILSKEEQKRILGGVIQEPKECVEHTDCESGEYCSSFSGKCKSILG